MAVIITAAMLRRAAASNAAKPDDERWSNLVTASGRYAKRVKRKGIEASELRDERPQRAVVFGSEIMVAKRHGAKGGTKTLPGKLNFGRGAINTAIRLQNSLIRSGIKVGQPGNKLVKVIKRAAFNTPFDVLDPAERFKRNYAAVVGSMLSGGHAE